MSARKDATHEWQGHLVLELLKTPSGWQVWPVTESAAGPDWPVERKEMDRETSRRAIGHDPAESEPNEAAARATASVIAERARVRYGWRFVSVRESR